MKRIIQKCKTLLPFKKKEPWYKRILRKTALIMDMKRRNKFITFFALLFIAVYFCMPSMESIVKKVVHKYGSEITGTDVRLGGFSIKLKSGEGIVRKIKIGNPAGYNSNNLFFLNEIGIKVNISSLTHDTIIIDSIHIDNPQISYEMHSLKQNNVSDVLENIKKNTEKYSSSENKTEKHKSTAKQEKETSKKIIIKKLTVTNGEILLAAGKTNMKIALPNITMKNIGEEKSGASVAETLSQVITKILQTASQTVVSSNIKGLADSSLQQIKNISDNAKNKAADISSKGKETAKNLKNNLGGLLKK